MVILVWVDHRSVAGLSGGFQRPGDGLHAYRWRGGRFCCAATGPRHRLDRAGRTRTGGSCVPCWYPGSFST